MRLRYFFRVLAFFAWAARCSHFGGTPMALTDTFQSFLKAESTALMTGFMASASLAAISQRVGQSIEGFAGLLHLLVIGECHAAVVDVGAQLVISAVGQTLAEREAGSFGSLAASSRASRPCVTSQ